MAQGSQSQLFMDPTSTIDGDSERYAFISETLAETTELDIDNSIRGSRSVSQERSGVSLKRVGGNIVMRPSPAELDNLLPRILGAAESTDTFDIDETVPSFSVMVDKVTDTYQYDGCKVGRGIFRGSEGGAVELTLELFGQTRTKSNSAPTIAMDTDNFYSFSDGVLTLNSVAQSFNDFTLTIDNLLEVLFENSETATTIEAADRKITLDVNLPFNAAADTLEDAIDNGATITGSLVFTNGNQSLTFTLPALMASTVDPQVSGKSKIRKPISFQALKTGTTAELTVTHDSTA